jgi:hypothetical protein
VYLILFYLYWLLPVVITITAGAVAYLILFGSGGFNLWRGKWRLKLAFIVTMVAIAWTIYLTIILTKLRSE